MCTDVYVPIGKPVKIQYAGHRMHFINYKCRCCDKQYVLEAYSKVVLKDTQVIEKPTIVPYAIGRHGVFSK